MSKESQKAFYTKQRLDAEKRGDTKMTTAIYDKLNKAQYGEASETRAAKKSATPTADAADSADRAKYLDAQNVASAAEKQGRGVLSKIFGG